MKAQHSSKAAASSKQHKAAVNALVSTAAASKASAQHTAQPGIIASIMLQLVNAHVSKRPVTVAQILAQLSKQFPQRSSNGMLITVRAQLSRLPKERNFAICKTRNANSRVTLYAAAAEAVKQYKAQQASK